MPLREYTCAECAGTFSYECRGPPRVCCEDCAPIRKRKQIAAWGEARTPERKRSDYDKQRERSIVRAATWNRENRERRAEILRKFDQQPHIKARARARNYPKSLRWYVDLLTGDPCCYCGAPSEHIDHIDPLARGGETTTENLTAACLKCNVGKSAQPLLMFLLARR